MTMTYHDIRNFSQSNEAAQHFMVELGFLFWCRFFWHTCAFDNSCHSCIMRTLFFKI